MVKSKNSFPKLKGKAILSPMAGVTDVAFRTLCKKYGAAMTYTEFISASGVVRQNKKTLKLVETDPVEKPVGVQLFGSSVDEVVAAAKAVGDRFDVIDINCGCPAWKVIKTGAGSAMLNDPKKISTFVNKLVEGIDKPITVKIRSGIDKNHVNAVEIAKAVEDAGAAAIAIHGRTQKQAYRGQADWDIIKQVKDAVSIPVIGNGDVTTPEIFKQRLDETNVDAIMIARAAIGNPYFFTQINDYLKTGEYDPANKIKHFSEFLKLAVKYDLDFSLIKQHAMYFTKGTEKSSKLRVSISQAKTIEELKELL